MNGNVTMHLSIIFHVILDVVYDDTVFLFSHIKCTLIQLLFRLDGVQELHSAQRVNYSTYQIENVQTKDTCLTTTTNLKKKQWLIVPFLISVSFSGKFVNFSISFNENVRVKTNVHFPKTSKIISLRLKFSIH